MLKVMKPGKHYFIIRIDEPYAKAIYEVLKCGEIAKGEGNWPEGDISFEEWKELTFVTQMKHLQEMLKKEG